MVNLSLTQTQYRKIRITLIDAMEYYGNTAMKLRQAGMLDLAKDYENRKRETRYIYLSILKNSTEYSIVEKAAEDDRQQSLHFEV